MKHRFISFGLFLALVMSGQQVLAADYVSAVTALTEASFTKAGDWTADGGACGAAAAAAAARAVSAADTFTICDGHTLTVGAAFDFATIGGATGLNHPATITVATGGKLIINGVKFTYTGALATAGSATGEIIVKAGGELMGSTLTTAGTGTVTGETTGIITLTGNVAIVTGTKLVIGAGGKFTTTGNVTVTDADVTIADGGELKAMDLATVTGKGVTVSSAGKITLTGTLNVGNATTIVLGTSGALEVGGAATVASTGTITGGTVTTKDALTTNAALITGIVKPTVTGSTIIATGAATIASLDLSGLAVDDTFLVTTSTLTLTSILNGTLYCGTSTDFPTGTTAAAPYAGGTAAITAAGRCQLEGSR